MVARLGLLAAALGACSGGTGPTAGACDPVPLVGSSPADGQTEVALDASISVTLDGGGAGVEAWVDGGGTGGWVALSGAGPDFSVPLAGLLAPGTTHTLALRRCGSEAPPVRFTTRPGPSAAAAVGRVWLLDLWSPALAWAEPGVAPPFAVLESLLDETRGLMVAPLSADGDQLAVGLALAERRSGRLRQDACLPAVTVEDGALSADPDFAATTPEVQVDDADQGATLLDVVVSGRFSPDGATVTDLRLAALLDSRGLESSGLDLCGSAGEVIDATCVACPDQVGGEAPACMLLDVTAPTVSADPDLTFDADPAPHAGCR